MSKTYTITVQVQADESDRLLNTDALRESIARLIDVNFSTNHDQHGHEEVSALVNAITVDGRMYDFDAEKLEESPITPEIDRLIRDGKIIQAIKMLRDNNFGMGLAEAKGVVDKHRYNR